jgi:hypothetical protein
MRLPGSVNRPNEKGRRSNVDPFFLAGTDCCGFLFLTSVSKFPSGAKAKEARRFMKSRAFETGNYFGD